MMKRRKCGSCTKFVPVVQTDLGSICCSICGKVLEEDLYSTEATFVKDAAGRSMMAGNIVNAIERESRERTLDRAYDTIVTIADDLGVDGGDSIYLPAKRFYAMALEKNFTRGRRADQVAAACLYIACRVNDKPFLLIEFSEFLRVNVYVLGAVFLQLCKLLQLSEHPVVQKPVDPSLFVRRFVSGLLGETNHEVEKTTIRIITSMKRNWMQTGRKPSGICGAALYISALSHGFKFSKADIVRIVHICEATLTKRLIEFEETESGCLTIEEFTKDAQEVEKEVGKKVDELRREIEARKGKKCKDSEDAECKESEKDELLCEHKGNKVDHFAHGLCEHCFAEFVTISGGLDGGSQPPAFQRAERERLFEEEARKLHAGESDQFGISGSVGLHAEHDAVDGGVDESRKADYFATEGDESESFSDIDDAEVDSYLHNEEEKHYKKIIWEDLNREYLQEQAAKAALAALREPNMVDLQNCSGEMLAAREFAAAVSANTAKTKKERQQKRAAEAKKAQTAAEATHQVLTKKRISSKVNYDKLKELLDEPEVFGNPKKNRTESHEERNDLSQTMKKENKAVNNENEMETVDEFEANNYAEYQDQTYDYGEEYEEFDDGLY